MNTAPAVVLLDPALVEDAIKNAESESHAIEAIFKTVYPQWDKIEKVDGFPACNQATWKVICRWFQDKTTELNTKRAYDKKVMPGGPWMNWGFTTIERVMPSLKLENWEVLPAPATMKEGE